MYLKTETQQNIERIVGLPLNQIQSLTLDEEICHIETRTGKKLRWPAMACRFNTGNPLLSLGRYRTMEDVNKRFDNMFPIHSLWWKLKSKFRRV